ncbi:MAG: hypothetical protein WBV82_01710 [Myxococcaceae bacterium]
MRARALIRWTFTLTACIVFAGTMTACGTTETPKCGPETCASGCCLSDTECVPLRDQSHASCGQGGKACRACLPDETCGSAGCVRRVDAGTGGCGPGTCAGCCTGDGFCVAPSLQDDFSCGLGGTTCAACLTGFTCEGGGCVSTSDPGPDDAGSKPDAGSTPDAGTPPDAGTKAALGAPCTSSSQCATGLCQQLGFNGGYCTRSCQSAADCPSGSTCGSDPNGSATNICLTTCSSAGGISGCRPGYVCEKRATLNGTPACVPGCNSVATCGVAPTCDGRGFCCGSEGFACCDGQSCGSGLQCTSGYCTRCGAENGPCCAGGSCSNGLTCSGNVCKKSPVGGSCAQESACQSGNCVEVAPGNTPGCDTGPCWPGGYCTADCTNNTCPAGSSCTPYLNRPNSMCVVNCPSPGTQSTCRAGYVCDKGWIETNPNQGICLDACNADADCNSVNLRCNQGFCCGQIGYRCCAGNTCPFSGTCQSDGYCG